jgi:hypothetical protein
MTWAIRLTEVRVLGRKDVFLTLLHFEGRPSSNSSRIVSDIVWKFQICRVFGKLASKIIILHRLSVEKWNE